MNRRNNRRVNETIMALTKFSPNELTLARLEWALRYHCAVAYHKQQKPEKVLEVPLSCCC